VYEIAMGLLYVFPSEIEESDNIKIDSQKVTLRTYGLPYIFWVYALAILTAIFFLGLAVKGPLEKLLSYEDTINYVIGYGLIALLICVPLTLISLFFYEKEITRTNNEITIRHKLFYIPILKKVVSLENKKLEVGHFLDSPNMARIQGGKEAIGFQNKGYFELNIVSDNGQRVFLDRHSRKTDLDKLLKLLESF
jgi:hypothetical protein